MILALTGSTEVLDRLRSACPGAVIETAVHAGQASALAEMLHPALVVVEVRRDREEGVRFCRLVRARPEWDGVPILMLGDDIGSCDLGDLLESGRTLYLALAAAPGTLRRTLLDLAKAGEAGFEPAIG